jgi:hypothetical protein
VIFTDDGDLYEYDVSSGTRTRLTEGAEVQFSTLGASENGAYVYFVANNKLVEGAESGNCSKERPSAQAACSLYVWHDGVIGLVTVLSAADIADWSPFLPKLVAHVSRDGHWLAFMSQRSLTGYDNRDARSGKPDEEVYLYNAMSGAVACVSCDPTGARPSGVEYSQLEGIGAHSLVGGPGVWLHEQWLAADIPGWTPYTVGQSFYQSHFLSDDGRLFFNSDDGLAPQDANGTWDVYEYEPPGVGDCSAESSRFVAGAQGCVGMISSGTSSEESAFLDASESGSDVFFLTAAQLSRQDNDRALDIYDAHECTSASPCLAEPSAPSAACASEGSCRAPQASQPAIYGVPASAIFSGLGNLTAAAPALTPRPTGAQGLAKALGGCRHRFKHSKRRRAACERAARHRFGKTGGKQRGARR